MGRRSLSFPSCSSMRAGNLLPLEHLRWFSADVETPRDKNNCVWSVKKSYLQGLLLLENRSICTIFKDACGLSGSDLIGLAIFKWQFYFKNNPWAHLLLECLGGGQKSDWRFHWVKHAWSAFVFLVIDCSGLAAPRAAYKSGVPGAFLNKHDRSLKLPKLLVPFPRS